MSRKHDRVPPSLENTYKVEEFDAELASVVLKSLVDVHPDINDPDELLSLMSDIMTTLGHIAGASEFCGGIDTPVGRGQYEFRFNIPYLFNPLVQREIAPINSEFQ